MAKDESVIQEAPPKAKRTPRRSGRKGAFGTVREISEDQNIPYSSVRETEIREKTANTFLGDSRVRRVRWSDWDEYVARSTERAPG